MPCYHPIIAYDNTDYTSNPEKMDIVFNAKDYRFNPLCAERQGRLLQLPCRHCVGCRLDHSKEWANRILLEQKYHASSYFVTLTYDDEHLPVRYGVDSSTGEILAPHASLVKADLQKFFKRLRKATKQKLSYFCSGEYGSQTYRPHYHCIIFGLVLNDLKEIKRNFGNEPYFVSSLIEKVWPFGMHVIGRVTMESAAYVARYTLKKATHGFSKEYYEIAGIEPEFQTISSKPAIGRRFYDENIERFKYCTFSVSTPTGGLKMSMPEYFRKKYKEIDPVFSVKKSRAFFINSAEKRKVKMSLTDLQYCDILSIEEEKRLSRISSLTRDDI